LRDEMTQQMASSTPPLVVLLDLDGTLVGKVSSVLCEYQLLQQLSLLSGPGIRRPASAPAASAPASAAVQTVQERVLRDAIVSRLRYGIIRPNVLRFCKEVGPRVELFVYTASDAAWANFFVPCVEAALGIKFNRPIFTRDQCSRDMRKSIDRLLPQISRSLRRRYPAAAASLRDRVLLVDNTPDVMAAPVEASRVVVCPTYGYSYNYDVLRHVPVDLLHTGFERIAPMLERYGLFPTGVRPDSFQRFASAYYRRLSRTMEATLAPNLSQIAGDKFFLRLLHAVNSSASKGELFTDAAIRDINRSVGWNPPRAAAIAAPHAPPASRVPHAPAVALSAKPSTIIRHPQNQQPPAAHPPPLKKKKMSP
jgi:hypothetical protein